MIMGRMRKQTYQCAQYKPKIRYKAWQQKHSDKHVFVKKYKSGCQICWHETKKN